MLPVLFTSLVEFGQLFLGVSSHGLMVLVVNDQYWHGNEPSLAISSQPSLRRSMDVKAHHFSRCAHARPLIILQIATSPSFLGPSLSTVLFWCLRAAPAKTHRRNYTGGLIFIKQTSVVTMVYRWCIPVVRMRSSCVYIFMLNFQLRNALADSCLGITFIWRQRKLTALKSIECVINWPESNRLHSTQLFSGDTTGCGCPISNNIRLDKSLVPL